MPESMDQLFAFVESLDRNREAHAALIADLLARPACFDAAYVVDYAARNGHRLELAAVEAYLQDPAGSERRLTGFERDFLVGRSRAMRATGLDTNPDDAVTAHCRDSERRAP